MPRLSMIQLRELVDDCNSRDLAALIQADLGAPKTGKGKDLYWLCPDHTDHSPSLHFNRRKNAAFCNPCGKRWTPLNWVMKRHNLKMMEAIEFIIGQSLTTVDVVAPAKLDKPYAPPAAEWQSRATNVVAYCVANLWVETPEAERVRAYLNRRGLRDQTLRDWKVGYNPHGQDLHGLWVWPGIIIPAYMQGVLWGIKIRLLPDHPFICQGCKTRMTAPGRCPKCNKKNKYRQVAGSEPALFGMDTCRDRRVVFGAEGEFDAMLLYQEAWHLGGVFTTTNGAAKDWRLEWSLALMDAERVILLYDNDEAGQGGMAKLMHLGERVSCVRVPQGNDLTDFFVRGGNVGQWVTDVRREMLAKSFLNDRAQKDYIEKKLPQMQPGILQQDYAVDLAELLVHLQLASPEMAEGVGNLECDASVP